MLRRALPLLLLALAVPASAQRKDPTKRPALAGADTNDAYKYYDLALNSMTKDPGLAADALYWANRINPGWADALYARRVALLLADRRRMQNYMQGDKRTVQSKEIQRIDSLYYRALMQNPFIYQKLDRTLFDEWIRAIADDISRSSGDAPGSIELEHYLQLQVQRMGPAMQAWLAYGSGRFPEALAFYAQAIKSARRKSGLRTDRGRLFFQIGEVDSAKIELTLALEEMQKRDKKDVVYVYESKALLEHGIAMIHERKNEFQEAREAYGRALTEDLSYYPAHMGLGFLALGLSDTAMALNEMELAVQIRGDEPMLRYVYGYTLAFAGKYADAETQLKKALELEPLYALPYHVLGGIYEKQGKTEDARLAYEGFLARSAQTDTRRVAVLERMNELKVATPAGEPQP